ncbi:hypothetical protein [Chryseobacterium sp. LAM-KRS1]|uniref:hypothetical protein n=1 Tax=Chryseobacterium sp. LAM-KRS1 TaxID=2715754 RepID=UPI001557E7D6|nr:hypothetical protein [Chryseobacterium sp. LAM-KRS1]
MKKTIISLFAILLLGCNSKGQENKVRLTGDQVIIELENLHFFGLTEKEDLEESKANFKDSYERLHFFEGKERDDSTTFTDNRFYSIDCEVLFESEGLIEYLEIVRKAFDKLGLELKVSDEFSKQNKKHWLHKIKLNGKEYIAYDNDFGMYDWDISVVNFIRMLNDQLSMQNAGEKFYPIRSGNDGMMVLLTKEQFDFVRANYPNDKDHPKELSEWENIRRN